MDFSRRSTAELREKLNLSEKGSGSVGVVIEASGAEACIQMGMFLVREAGVYVQGESDFGLEFGLLLLFDLPQRETGVL